MEEQEIPIEKVQEHIEHHAHLSPEKWISAVALSTAILAALAAIASLLSGEHANEGMLSQIDAANQWSYYQAKGIKSGLLGSRIEILKALGQAPAKAEEEKLEAYAKEQQEIRENAESHEKSATKEMHTHEILARAVTLFQIAIAISAISVMTRRRLFWGVGLLFGTAGVFFLVHGFLTVHG